MNDCDCATKPIISVEDLCASHKTDFIHDLNTASADNSTPLEPSPWIRRRLEIEATNARLYAEQEQASNLDIKRNAYIEKMRAGLSVSVLALDHLLGPHWFRADPGDVAAIQACFEGLDAYQMLISEGISPPPRRVLNFINQRVKLDAYLGDSITDVCGCAEVVETGHQLCHFHRQHYFAYRQKADPATMLHVQQWAQKRRNPVSVWTTKGGLP